MTYSTYKEKTATVQKKYSEKSDISKETEIKETETKKDADSGRETTQNKPNSGERQHDIRREDTSSRHLWLINYGERTSTSPLALSYPLLGSSCYILSYYCMP